MKTAVRRVLLLSALLSPSALYALGLGEIRLNSALNQPFDAEIELVSAAQEDLSALRASLASSDTFVRYGLDKPAYLSEFTFQVVRSGGRDVLRITSPKPVTEPFVTLLVEANWPRGRLLREYTVLLDPPVFAPTPVASAPAVAPPAVAAPRPAPVAPSAPVRETVPAVSAEPVRRTAAVAVEPGSSYRVQRNDTLWRIASAAYPGGRSDVNRAMVAIYQANPAAFGGNINVLRAGSELQMPSSGDVAAISASAAADEVARQYRMWREGAAAAATDSSDAGRLRLVTPEQGTAAPSTATAAAPAGAGSSELQAKVQELEAELAEARRLLEVRNAELATLQGGTAAEPLAGEGPAPTEEPAPVEGAEPSAEETAPAGEAAAPAATEEATPEPEPEPAATPTPAPTLFDRLREYWWAVLGLLVAALGIAAFLRRRREASTAEEDLEEALSRRADLRNKAAAATVVREPSILVEERKPVEPALAKAAATAPLAAEPARTSVGLDDTLSGEGPIGIESGDPLAEADFHMAYGLYDQAADLVQVASRREPARRDLKLKLLEIYFVWGNKDRFLDVARELHASRAGAPAGEWDKVLIMGRQLAPEESMFAGSARAASDSLDMELSPSDQGVDIELAATRVGTLPDVDLTATAPLVSDGEGGLDFVLDEPVRGEDESSTAPTVETPRVRAGSSEDPTAEVPIEDLGLDVGEVEGLDEATEDLEAQLRNAGRANAEDTAENPVVPDEVDLLSSTSIMGSDSIASALQEREEGVVDLSEATGELPTIETARIESTGILQKPDFDLSESTGELPTIEAARIESTGLMQKPDFDLGEEAATMSEVGTKLDLARAYIDMGDPEGARSILEEVLKEGNPNQRKEAERLVSGLP